MSLRMQLQSSRNLVLAAKTQASPGGVMADANFTMRQRIDLSTVFEKTSTRRNDMDMVGKGTQFATEDQVTAWDTKGTLKADLNTWLAGYLLALCMGSDVVTGSATPYNHAFAIPSVTADMPLTNVYVEETADQKFKMNDLAVSAVTFTVPERGAISVSADFVGTGRWTPGAMVSALPALAAENILLGSDFVVTITPSGGAATPFSGRQQGLTIKIDRGATPFKASGDGLYASTVAAGAPKFSIDLNIAADATDDVNGWFESGTSLAIAIATNPANTYQLQFSFPVARVKANKLGNQDNKVMWGLSFDETTCLQSGATPAMSALVINEVATTYLTAV